MIKSTGAVVVPSPNAATNELAGVEIRDIRPLTKVPMGWEWLAWVVVGLVSAFILRKIWLLWQGRPPARSKGPSISPEQKAHQQLDAALGKMAEPKVFCSVVSDAVRVYLEDRFRFRAPERTTEEFLLELQKSPRLSVQQKQMLESFLERCDMVKFARAEPAQTELKELHSVAHQLVEETRSQTMEALTPEKSEEETAREAARKAALRLELEKRLIKSMVLAICLAGLGTVMLFWSDVPFVKESATGFRGDVLNPILEALCSKPVSIALCVLGAVYLIEAALCKARRLAL